MVFNTNEKKLQAIRQIEGLDVDAGLKTIANMVPAYIRVLGIFVKGEGRNVGRLDEQLATDDMEAFQTTIHGYKSALSNLGAFECARLAQLLEVAAKNDDRTSIDEKLPAFKENVGKLVMLLGQVLG